MRWSRMMESSSAVKHTFPSSSNKTKHEQKKVLAPNGALTAEEEKRLSLSRFCLCHLKYPKRHGQQRVHFVSGLITAVGRHYILLPQPPPRTEHRISPQRIEGEKEDIDWAAAAAKRNLLSSKGEEHIGHVRPTKKKDKGNIISHRRHRVHVVPYYLLLATCNLLCARENRMRCVE